MVLLANNKVESVSVRVPSESVSKSASSSSSSSPKKLAQPYGEGGCCRALLMMQNRKKFSRSSVPYRIMYFKSHGDSVDAGGGEWVDFSSEVMDSLRQAFVERRPLIDVSFVENSKVKKKRYVFDFIRMLQIDFYSANQRSIAWIDQNGKCFFPKIFVDFDDNKDDSLCECNENCGFANEWKNEKIEIEISVKRKNEGVCREEPEVSSVMKRQRVLMSGDIDAEKTASRWPNTSLLKEGESTYCLVKERFLAGMRKVDPGVKITAIHQCLHTGHLEKARYETFMKQMGIITAVHGVPNVQCAWYGAPAKSVEGVLSHGFGVPNKLAGPESYGVGVYLTPFGLPHLSARFAEADDNGEKHMMMCRVILGKVEKVEAGSQQFYQSKGDFDTGSDEPNNPNWYIVWPSIMNIHILPVGVVSFRSSNNVQDQMRALPSAKYSIEKLFSKIRYLLPPTGFREVVSLYDAFRAGKLAKDIFIKQLRGIAGDDILKSTIKEIRGLE